MKDAPILRSKKSFVFAPPMAISCPPTRSTDEHYRNCRQVIVETVAENLHFGYSPWGVP
jgi:hypothetical protein